MPTPTQQAQTPADPWEAEAAKMKGSDTQAVQPSAVQKTPDDDWKIWQQGGSVSDAGPLDEFAQWGAKTFPNVSRADAARSESDALNPERGPAPELTRILANAGNTFMRGATALPAGIVDSVKQAPAGIVDSAKQAFDPEQYLHPIKYEQDRLAKNAAQPGTEVTPGNLKNANTEENYADYASDLAGKGALALGTGKLAEFGVGGLLRAPGALKRMLTGDVMAPAAGSSVSPFARYNAAKRLGVNLDAADATGSPLLGNLKRINENSLFGGHLYDNLKARNTGALQDSTEGFLNGMYDGDRESGGREILGALKNDHEGLRKGAETGFKQLTEQTKGSPVKGAPAVGQAAGSILNTIEPLADKYPSLAPGKTMNVLHDLTRVGAQPVAPPTGFLDAPGSEFAVPRKINVAPMDTWSDLQRLRSATHDLTTTNPDLVKSQAIAPLQQMTSSLDDAMTNASSGLTPAQEALFRSANRDWKDMKATYDDPSSPFYHAVRTDNPSTLFKGVGPQTPENALNLRKRISPFESFADEPSPALGALRRGTVESALKPNNEGAPNFPNFGANLNRIPADYRAELFSPEQNSTLRDINLTSNALAKDFNPSGTMKVGQKIGEAAALVPTLGLPTLQYPLAKIMTNPGIVERLMRPPTKPNLFFAPAAGAATAATTAATTARRRLNQ